MDDFKHLITQNQIVDGHYFYLRATSENVPVARTVRICTSESPGHVMAEAAVFVNNI